jgi:hypothetical protein
MIGILNELPKIFTFMRVIDAFWDAAVKGLINLTDVSKGYALSKRR